jgi:hypothetical protein
MGKRLQNHQQQKRGENEEIEKTLFSVKVKEDFLMKTNNQ